jgi:F0F1-type ATP synthase membrane subunit a
MDTISVVILVLVIVILLWGITRLRSRKTAPRLQIAMEIISNVNDNLRLLAEWQTGKLSKKKFKIKSLEVIFFKI